MMRSSNTTVIVTHEIHPSVTKSTEKIEWIMDRMCVDHVKMWRRMGWEELVFFSCNLQHVVQRNLRERSVLFTRDDWLKTGWMRGERVDFRREKSHGMMFCILMWKREWEKQDLHDTNSSKRLKDGDCQTLWDDVEMMPGFLSTAEMKGGIEGDLLLLVEREEATSSYASDGSSGDDGEMRSFIRVTRSKGSLSPWCFWCCIWF